MKINKLACIVLFSVALAGCKIIDWVEVNNAVQVVDNGIGDITRQSDQWQEILKQVSEKLPKDIQSTVRNEMDQLVQRSIAQTGVEFRCNADFLAQRAIQGLRRIRALLTGQQPEPVTPGFCQVIPSALNFNERPETRASIRISGYDLDSKDSSGNKPKLFLWSDSSLPAATELAESRIGRTTHYQLDVNVADAAFETMVHQKNISKIKVSWGAKTEGYPEIIVIRRVPKTQTVTVNISKFSYTPPHTGGDFDFDTRDDEPMKISVRSDIMKLGNKLLVRVYMWAFEPRPDYTKADGTSAWNTAYEVPAGWKIVSFSPSASSVRNESINSHGMHTYNLPAGELVNRFEVWGDQDDDEAGSYTRVNAVFNPVKVNLEEILPY